MIKFGNKFSCCLSLQLHSISFYYMNLNKFIIGLYFLIFSMHTKFQENKKSIVMSSIKYLNFKFL